MLIHLIISTLWFTDFDAAPLKKQPNDEFDIQARDLKYLIDKGYLAPFGNLVGETQNQQSIVGAIKSFQRFANIPMTGAYDNATRTMMAMPRCGMADFTEKDLRKRKRRYTLQGSRWEKQDLTWMVENTNNDGIRMNQVRDVMQKSFAKWHAATNLNFRELVDKPIGSADIRVTFQFGNHGDRYPFDGNGGTLAHAFYPHNNKGLSGDVHFDDDEVFTVTNDKDRSKRKLLWIAVHELGHSIGLEHSSIKGAVMYPWYQHFEGDDFDLTYDDIVGIQNLYGGKASVTKTTTSTTPKKVTQPTKAVPCTNHVGAILLGRDGKTYIMNGNKLYIGHRQNAGVGLEQGPIDVKKYFNTLSTVDAVFRRSKQDIVFFHGDEFSVYDSTTLKYPARKITDGFQNLPNGFRDVDAAFRWSVNQKLYIFKGERYWRLSQLQNLDYTADAGYPKIIAKDWHGLPKTIDAAFEWSNGKTYFFKGEYYYRYDSKTRAVRSGYPQKSTISFLKCPAGGKLQAGSLTSSDTTRLRTSIGILMFFISCYLLL